MQCHKDYRLLYLMCFHPKAESVKLEREKSYLDITLMQSHPVFVVVFCNQRCTREIQLFIPDFGCSSTAVYGIQYTHLRKIFTKNHNYLLCF